MSAISRRTFLGAASVATVAGASGMTGLSSAPALAAAPPATQQVPSAYRYKVGSYQVTALSDGARTMPLADNFVRNQPRDAVNAALQAAFLPADQVTISFTALLINTGDRLVLIDTGNGPQEAGASAPVGQLAANLKASGVEPDQIDAVVISHFHGDHINGLLDAKGAPAFPKAQLLVPEPEWAFWMDDGNMSRAPDAQKGAFQNARRVFAPFGDKAERYGWDQEVVPGLKSVGTAGHTPGHTSFLLTSGDGTLFIQSDVTNIPSLFVRNPSWHVMFDMDPAKAEEVRKRTFDMIAAERLLLAGYHFPFPAAAHLEKDGAHFTYVPVPWSPVL